MSCRFLKLFTGTIERLSPSDIVKRDAISFMVSNLIVDLTQLNIPFSQRPKVWICSVPDTNSMDPGFDYGHNNILVAGADEADHKIMIDFLKVGDIAVYRIPPDLSQPAKAYMIHRIVEIGKDGEGRFFRFRGDNNSSRDLYKVRDENILWVCAGTIF